MTEWKRKKAGPPSGESTVTIGANREDRTSGTGAPPAPGLAFGQDTSTGAGTGWVNGTGAQGPGRLAIGSNRVKPAWQNGVGASGPARMTTTQRDPVKRFAEAVEAATAPADATQAQERTDELVALLESMTPQQRKTIADDKPLMTKARSWVGNHQYMALAAAAGVFAAKPGTAPDGTASKDVNHMSGSEADEFIKTAMAAVPHLKAYLEEAVAAGRKGDGFIAVLDDEDWNAVYPQEFPDEAIGSDDERYTNAFVSNVKRGPAIIKKDRGTRSTAIHESMHRYAEDDVNNRWGFDLNEGITEYFTRLITDRDGNPAAKGGPPRDNYDSNVKFVRNSLIKVLGSTTKTREIALAEIYFKGKTDLLKTKVMAMLKKKGRTKTECEDLWKDLEDALSGGDWSAAKAILA